MQIYFAWSRFNRYSRFLSVIIVFIVYFLINSTVSHGQSGLNQQATVLIQVSCQDTNNGAINDEKGTGFVIERSGYILTALHVVACRSQNQKKQLKRESITVQFGSPSASRLPADLIKYDDQSDVALLKIHGNPGVYPSLKACSLRSPPAETQFVAAGFPEGRGYQPVGGIIGNTEGEGGKWSVASPFSAGMSGGPVAHEGYVVGLVTGGFENVIAARTVTPIYKALQLIESETGERIPRCQAAFTPQSPGSCRPLEEDFQRPMEVQAGACFTSPSGESRGRIDAVLSDAVRFTDSRSNKQTCYRGEVCSFGWPGAPKFVFHYDETLPNRAMLSKAPH
jgi:Trypsin-like peptidase domain